MKFDIEGAEFEILLHSQKLSQIKFINVELHPGGIRQDLYDAVIEILPNANSSLKASGMTIGIDGKRHV